MRAERIEDAARALLAVVDGREKGLRGYYIDAKRFDALRAALELPADAAGSAEAVRAACAAVPALEEARRRRLRWADEAHAQILAVPAPAQPAPEWAVEAVRLAEACFGHVYPLPVEDIITRAVEAGKEPA